LSGYFVSNSVFVPALLDTEGSICKDNCVKSNKHRPILSAAKCSSSFWIYKVYAGHSWRFLVDGASNYSGIIVTCQKR